FIFPTASQCIGLRIADQPLLRCGGICPHCQSLKSKYGEPQSCSICNLKTAFGSALVCQRCLHYRNRFGEPRQCHSCGNTCAFLKDEVRFTIKWRVVLSNWLKMRFNILGAMSDQKALFHSQNKTLNHGVPRLIHLFQHWLPLERRCSSCMRNLQHVSGYFTI
ncbi:unnamed protein product, partial [Schistosoma curassoni]|uniref:Laminin EGF-like domain-containing protein n=1 Tax=Schistosoma curassoni TaxID=6186 RepID=A0A183JRM5_9TREM